MDFGNKGLEGPSSVTGSATPTTKAEETNQESSEGAGKVEQQTDQSSEQQGSHSTDDAGGQQQPVNDSVKPSADESNSSTGDKDTPSVDPSASTDQ